MKRLIFILTVLLSVQAYSQHFLRDAQNRIIKTEVNGSMAFLVADTVSSYLREPPYAAKSFTISQVNSPSGMKKECRGYWTLEESTGPAVDSTGTADLTHNGSVTTQQTGDIDYCYSLASGGYLGPVDGYYEITGSLTVVARIKTNHEGSLMCIMSNYGTANRGWDLDISSDGVGSAVAIWQIRGAWGTTQCYGTIPVNDNTWHVVGGTYSAEEDSSKLWIDGVIDTRQYSAYGPEYDGVCDFRIGSRHGSWSYVGSVDEPGVWSKALTQTEWDSIMNDVQYPFPWSDSGDSLRIQVLGHDPRGDSCRIQIDTLNYPDDKDDELNIGAYPMSDSLLWNDTIIYFPYGPKDTIWYAIHGTGIMPEDLWSYAYDTTFMDSTDIIPPEQDVGIWDSIWALDFEDYSAPHDYIESEKQSDWFNHEYFGSEHPWPVEWTAPEVRALINDSIIVDPISGSNVLKYSFTKEEFGGVCGDDGHRGGEVANVELPQSYQEIYFSFNMMLRPGWLPSGGGKFPGMGGGHNDPGFPCPPGDDRSWKMDMMWHWPDNYYWQGNYYNWYLSTGWYAMYQNMNGCPYSEWLPWREYNPTGENLQYHNNPDGYGYFYFDVTDSTWYNITMRFVMNTFTGEVPNADGIAEGFINGKLIESRDNVIFMNYGDYSHPDSWYHGINTIWWRHFWGGGGCPLRDEWSLFDDIWLFTFDESVEVPRGNEASQAGRVVSLPNWPKPTGEPE